LRLFFRIALGGTNLRIKRSGIIAADRNQDKENFNALQVEEIRREYERIDDDWLRLHYKTSVGLVIFACMIEFVMGVLLIHSDMLTTTALRFVLKFMVIPSGVNLLCVAADTAIIRSERFSQKQKIYSVSLIFVGICFILFTVHSTFTAIYYIFAIGIMLTTIYANYRVTSITALTSIAAIVISELFIVWDVDKSSIFESTHRLSDFIISLFVLTAFSIVCMVVVRFEREKNLASIQIEIERQRLQKRLQVDEMTGIFNRKALHEALKQIEDDAPDGRNILAIVDLDQFKGINDNWGHHLGDRCLIEFTKILKENRGKFIPFRYGGDEFCLLFRNAEMEDAKAVCEKLRSRLDVLHFEDCPGLKLTASFGLAACTDQMDAVRLFIQADHALYEAKKVRNAVHVFQKEA